jgi:glycosyltransferase involved in cell wall biosynthesis
MTAPKLSIVTCCKGRLKYLKQALPTFVAQAESEVVVVDYDCPEGTEEWVAANFPQVRLVAVTGAPVFNASRARNLGADHARAPWLLFCDADDLLSPSFASDVLKLAEPGTYQRTLRRNKPGPMPLACETTTFGALGGYDDAMQGWGLEDVELITRLGLSGVREVIGSAAVVENLWHSRAEVIRYYEHKVEVSLAMNYYYCFIKGRYFQTSGRWFNDEQRHSMYGSVQQAVLASLADPGRDATYDIPLVASAPPWSARLKASDVRSFFQRWSEHLIEKPPPV